MGRDERLERWAESLDREPTRRLITLHRLEFVSRSERPNQRADGSPIAVAFADPLLRASGLSDDTYGAALATFGLSERPAHRLLCWCVNGYAVEARRVAVRLPMMVPRQRPWDALIRARRSALALQAAPPTRRGLAGSERRHEGSEPNVALLSRPPGEPIRTAVVARSSR